LLAPIEADESEVPEGWFEHPLGSNIARRRGTLTIDCSFSTGSLLRRFIQPM
jgi:hypothetical protein